ncbi:MAG: hypothetical protein M0010_15260 [Actinomycetota bacterium]|nr:hypothetical protein [Actinomycetota bacterium]
MARRRSRFSRLERSLAHRKGVRHPRALAAWIGDRKYGKAEMARRSATSRRRRRR